MDIDKIRKEMTREEFINHIDESGNLDIEECYLFCPSQTDGLLHKNSCISSYDCKECWKKSIKNIKFKGEEEMENEIFNWNEFKSGKIAVNCSNKESAIQFFRECIKRNMKWISGSEEEYIIFDAYNVYGENTCISCEDYLLSYCDIEYYLGRKYKIIKWKEIEKDYDKEYNIQEIFKFEDETEFLCEILKYKIFRGNLFLFDDSINKWCSSKNSIKDILNMKFKLVKKDKEVSFLEAIQAYGKTVYCKWEDEGEEIINVYKVKRETCQFIDEDRYGVCAKEILEGKWYIKED